ncbi:hypothetical protein [Brevibacillus daliensis]|uniref:hypothetical protein n=1 Tax=Brevibacillus daliensis TaxID=2892995 RepID=UPI001E33C1D2|nr:hypothetical protein [Brevibacillus daliensis]
MRNSRSERSRVRTKVRAKRRIDREVGQFWVMGLIFTLLIFSFQFFITIPEDAKWLLEMEMAFFSASFTLLALYLIGFTLVFSKQGDMGKISHQVIIYVWMVAILYHLFVLVSGYTNEHVYKAGIILFLGPVFLTMYHFITYMSDLRQTRREEKSSEATTAERAAYELINAATKMYNEIQRLQIQHPEVDQMLLANQFSLKLERYILEMQQFLQIDKFEPKDIELLEGHFLYVENILMLVKQLPDIQESRTYAAQTQKTL